MASPALPVLRNADQILQRPAENAPPRRTPVAPHHIRRLRLEMQPEPHRRERPRQRPGVRIAFHMPLPLPQTPHCLSLPEDSLRTDENKTGSTGQEHLFFVMAASLFRAASRQRCKICNAECHPLFRLCPDFSSATPLRSREQSGQHSAKPNAHFFRAVEARQAELACRVVPPATRASLRRELSRIRCPGAVLRTAGLPAPGAVAERLGLREMLANALPFVRALPVARIRRRIPGSCSTEAHRAWRRPPRAAAVT